MTLMLACLPACLCFLPARFAEPHRAATSSMNVWSEHYAERDPWKLIYAHFFSLPSSLYILKTRHYRLSYLHDRISNRAR